LIAGGIGAALVAILVAFLVNSASGSGSFRISRIQVWLDPETHSSLGGYQIMQALYAIGSGGFFGKGLGNSTQKLGALPEAQNDMIFSIICEELGVFGAVLVILMFVMMLYRLFFIAQNAPDLLGSLIVSGIFVHIALQVVLNIAVVTNMIPTTGITLPFVSYGGTSILFLMAEMALALSVSRQIRFK
jgi:cell division protein FtsW